MHAREPGRIVCEAEPAGGDDMHMVCPLLPLLSLLVVTTPLRAEITIPGRFDGGVRYITISDSALARSPAWNVGAANPPLSAREADRLATWQKARTLRDSKDWKWQLESTLPFYASDDKWFWVVEYHEHPQPGLMLDGVPGICRFVILMDGTVIEPQAQAPGPK
jgi:hypothetical protein